MKRCFASSTAARSPASKLCRVSPVRSITIWMAMGASLRLTGQLILVPDGDQPQMQRPMIGSLSCNNVTQSIDDFFAAHRERRRAALRNADKAGDRRQINRLLRMPNVQRVWFR